MDSTFNFKSCKELIHSGCSELTYVIDGLLAQGVYLLAAPPKTGKTWMALDMAISVSSGTSFIGRKTTQGTVLYLSYDDNENRITRRLKKMGCKDDTDVYFDFDPTSKSVEDDFLALISCAKETLPNLSFVVVDVLNYIKGKKVSTYDSDYELIKKLKSIAEEHNICILLVTHVTKDFNAGTPFRSICGSTGLAGAVDGSLVLSENHDCGVDYYTFQVTGNDIPSSSEDVIIDPYNFKWESLGSRSGKEGVETEKEAFVYALYSYLTAVKSEYKGTMSELAEILRSVSDMEFNPASIGKYLNHSNIGLVYRGITCVKKNTSEARLYHIQYDRSRDKYSK